MNRTRNEHSRLVLVSYRLPFKIKDGTLVQNAGGLVSAMLSFAAGKVGSNAPPPFKEIVWIGVSEDSQEDLDAAARPGSLSLFTLVPVALPEKLDQAFYGGFCNDLVWPLFHYFPSIADFSKKNYDAYKEANEFFSDVVLPWIRPDDTLWIHDYHFFLLPRLIRQRLPEAIIGFFLHIPFPSFEIFRLLPREWRKEILDGILGADMAGFHTFDYVQHFVDSVSRLLDVKIHDTAIQTEIGYTEVAAFPIGIDALAFTTDQTSELVQAEKQKILDVIGDRTMVFSVDRLDYSKGLLHRLQAFEEFLETYPEWHDKMVFNMVVVPSRDSIPHYQNMRAEIEGFVGRLNGLYSTLSWRPVVYQYRSLARHEMIALYDVAVVGLITPMRDGMNLVAKEFVCCQPADQPGILILSEMAGAAAELREALVINPNDRSEIAAALAEALSMSIPERIERWTKLRDRVFGYDVFAWADDFLDQLATASSTADISRGELLDSTHLDEIQMAYRNSESRLILLDYDGTLVPFHSDPEKAVPSSQLHNLLKTLSDSPKNMVCIISGRSADFLSRWFDELPIVLVAEHGSFMKMPGAQWTPAWHSDEQWKLPLLRLMHEAVSRCPGSSVEEKESAIVWHFRNSDPVQGAESAENLAEDLSELIDSAGEFRVVLGNHIVEVRPRIIDKGNAARNLVTDYPSQFVLAIGDDRTDEDMFAVVSPGSFSIKVGGGTTRARFHLRGPADVVRLLEKLSVSDK